MLTIDLEGTRALLDLLRRDKNGHPVTEAEVDEVLAANAFFVDFYSHWEGSSRETIRQAVLHFHQPEQVPAGMVPGRVAEALRQASSEMDVLESRMAWLGEIDGSAVAARVLAALPAETPLDSTVHITLDLVNNAFAHGGEMGVSLLKGAADRRSFEEAVSHELHHVGFRFWAEQDPVRRALADERSGRAVGVMHVQNLLGEGMANYYYSPRYVFGVTLERPPNGPYQARLARLQREEDALFARAEAILAMCLEPGAEYEPCWEAFRTIAFDMEEMMLPAGHYLGACMIRTMEQVHPRARIVACVQSLAEFLPLYNEAATEAGGFRFSAQVAKRYAGLWDWQEPSLL